jgi:hypothetical protein
MDLIAPSKEELFANLKASFDTITIEEFSSTNLFKISSISTRSTPQGITNKNEERKSTEMRNSLTTRSNTELVI